MPPVTHAHAAAEAPPTLLDALARAPAAAALVVAALEQAEDRKALRLTHPQLRDAVGEATTKLGAGLPAAARPPTSQRWPRLEELTVDRPDLATIEALGSATWRALRSLRINGLTGPDVSFNADKADLDAPAARALAAALRRMPALRALDLDCMVFSDAAAGELFRSSSAEAVPQLRALTVSNAELTLTAVCVLAAAGWRLEELDLSGNALGAAGLAALLSAPTFAFRRLAVFRCSLDAAALLALANAPWPLEELDLTGNNFHDAAAAAALPALSRHAGLRRLYVGDCLSAASFKALVEAAWPALTHFGACQAKVAFDALGAAAFAGFPALEELDLSGVALGEAGAALLASRRWMRLKKMNLYVCRLGATGVAALARGAWPALEWLNLFGNDIGAQLALEDARRWAPALVELRQ